MSKKKLADMTNGQALDYVLRGKDEKLANLTALRDADREWGQENPSEAQMQKHFKRGWDAGLKACYGYAAGDFKDKSSA